MSASRKLSTAVKALCYLSTVYPEPKNSADIAEKIGSNPSKLRKLLSGLVKNEVITSAKGTTGGFLLNKSPENINLQSVYCAVEERKAFHLDSVTLTENAESCFETFNEYFLGLFEDVQVEIENKMKTISLADILDKMKLKSSFN